MSIWSGNMISDCEESPTFLAKLYAGANDDDYFFKVMWLKQIDTKITLQMMSRPYKRRGCVVLLVNMPIQASCNNCHMVSTALRIHLMKNWKNKHTRFLLPMCKTKFQLNAIYGCRFQVIRKASFVCEKVAISFE